jgi:hypothetical protein
MQNPEQTDVSPVARRRLTPRNRDAEFRPWRGAHELTKCFLYWIPVSAFPVPSEQRVWLSLFVDRWAELLSEEFGLRSEVFLQMKSLQRELKKPFLDTSLEFIPMMGLSRRPHEPLPRPVGMEEVEALQKGTKKFELNSYIADYCYWFLNKSRRKQVDLFFGHGGMTLVFLKADPKTQPPKVRIPPKIRDHPMAQELKIEQMIACAWSLLDDFPGKSKQLFGTELEDDLQKKGLPFILPLLESRHFLAEPAEEVERWFSLFDVYCNESPADKGVLLAFKKPWEEKLAGLLKQMRDEGLEYPEK